LDRTHHERFLPLIDAAALAHLQTWQGKSETTPDSITTAPLRALSATLDRDDAPPARAAWCRRCGTGCISCRMRARARSARTATPARRLSAAGAAAAPHVGRRAPALGQRQPLRWGRRCSAPPPSSGQHKAGRSGELLFVLVEHQFRNAQGWR
jgi:3-methylfumaryl-CoA hydratase